LRKNVCIAPVTRFTCIIVGGDNVCLTTNVLVEKCYVIQQLPHT